MGFTSVLGFFFGFGGGRGGILPLLPRVPVPDWFNTLSFFFPSSLDGDVGSSLLSTLGILLKDPVSGLPLRLRVLVSDTWDCESLLSLNRTFLGSGCGVEVFFAVQLILGFTGS